MATAGQLIQPSTIDRVKKILTDPRSEWPVIEAEPTTVEKLYREYIVILSAIPVIAGFIGWSIIGTTLPFVGWYRRGIVGGVVLAVVTYVLGLIGVYVSAVVIEKLAPSFESTPDRLRALKLVAYAHTAAWVAGALNVLPMLGSLAILGGLYSIYLLYVGMPVMMKTPEPKVIPYMVVSALVIIVVSVCMMFIGGLIAGGAAMGAYGM